MDPALEHQHYAKNLYCYQPLIQKSIGADGEAQSSKYNLQSGPNEVRKSSTTNTLPAVRAALKEMYILKPISMLCNSDLVILLLIVCS